MPKAAFLTNDPNPGKSFARHDRKLDRMRSGPVWLKERRIANRVISALQYGERVRGSYDLHSGVVIPNHLHALLRPHPRLSEITRWLKTATANRGMALVQRKTTSATVTAMTTVVAGVLKQDGKILICRRRADQPHPLKWEFPGGKLEAGESPATALIRELREELGIESETGSEIMRYEFAYPGKQPILLIFLEVTSWRGNLENRIFETILWVRAAALAAYDFLEGDALFLTAFTGPES
jgi:8-oxo-dGTP diphosphatase